MINKKLFLAIPLSALLITPSVYAVSSETRTAWQQDPTFTFEEGYIGAILGTNRESALDSTNATGGIMAGYGAIISRFYIGAELSTQPIAVDAQLNNTTRINTRNIANLDVIPGYYITPDFLPYIRLGGGANYTKISGVSDQFDENSVTFSVRAGVGFDWRASDNFGLGLDYIYSRNDISNIKGLPNNSITALTNETVLAHLRYYF